jgi:hypothetical protein
MRISVCNWSTTEANVDARSRLGHTRALKLGSRADLAPARRQAASQRHNGAPNSSAGVLDNGHTAA